MRSYSPKRVMIALPRLFSKRNGIRVAAPSSIAALAGREGQVGASRHYLRFADASNQCDNTSMKNSLIATMAILMAATVMVRTAQAQQTPSANTQQTPAASAQKAPAQDAAQAPAAKSESPAPFDTQKEKASYAIGMNIAQGMKKNSIEFDPASLLRGMQDTLSGGKTLLTDQEAQATIMALQNDVRNKQQAQRQLAGETNKKEGDAFMTANKTKEGVVTLPSGLQYKILKAGDGPKPTASDSVVCHYRGTLLDGKEFDSSYKRGQPATFGVTQVIKGWTEALQLMPAGSKWQLFIPSDLAYGDRGAGADIGPNATLIFEVELLSIKPKAQ
jgi:FKBP-type peptidyl-prolyl cis-trans isomerase FklB